MNDFIKKSDYFYNLPEELIAQTPAIPRDSSRLLVFNRKDNSIIHTYFNQLSLYLNPGDILVLNNTKVIPARLFAYDNTGREFELLLLKRIDYTHYESLIKPAKKIKIGSELIVNEELKVKICEVLDDNGIRIIEFFFVGNLEDILSRVGLVPLPPYITEKLDDPNKYQTVYAKVDGSSAAPTAGLHFTQELLDSLRIKGVKIVEILLHVGLGTFRPVKEEFITEHKMHSEYYCVSEDAANIINEGIDLGKRIIAVGTTSVRTLESVKNSSSHIIPSQGETNIFIYPPYDFNIIDCMITNFHLPESTLLMLVSAFIGRDNALNLYRIAVKEKYRFFSFGDAMLLL